MLNKEERPYLSTNAAIEYHRKPKSEVKPSSTDLNKAGIKDD